MTALGRLVGEYLRLRRGLGFKLERAGRLLPDFVAHLEHHRAKYITAALAAAWARQPEDGHPGWWAQRLSIVRGFSAYVQALDPRTEVPAVDLLRSPVRRATPYLYSPGDVAQLVAAARTRMTGFRAETYAVLIQLLAVTGMRVGEAIALDREHVDLAHGVLIVHDSKFGKSREVPLHPSATAALAGYARLRDAEVRRPRSPAFLLSLASTRLLYKNVHFAFHRLVHDVGFEARAPNCRPRIHDLRHTFAVRTLIGWYRDGVDVAAHMPRLSTYLGHVDPTTTYWYLSATPELLGLVARRLDRAMRRRS